MPSQAATQENFPTGVIPAAPWRVQAVSVLPGWQQRLTDGLTIKNATDAGIFASLADEAFFARVGVELGVLTWPNGTSLNPAWLHENLATAKTWPAPFQLFGC